jgi:hypothetical protein
MADTVHRGRGRPPKTTAALFAEPFEFSIHPDAMGWLIAVKLPKVPVGAFKWLQDTPDIFHLSRDFMPGATLTFGYSNALDDGVCILQFRLSEFAAKETLGARDNSYDELTAMIGEYISKNGAKLSAIAKRIREYVGAD